MRFYTFVTVLAGMAIAGSVAAPPPNPTITYSIDPGQTSTTVTGTSGTPPVQNCDGDGYNTQFLKYHLDGQSGGGIIKQRRDVGSGRARRTPTGCSPSAIPGSCINCNHDGCGAFHCSAFTQWSCPPGYTHCGSETCMGNLCAGKYWCDLN